MNVNYNKFVDFEKLFSALIEENEQELDKYKYESDTYRKILEFLDTNYKTSKVDPDECEFTDDYFFFIFGHDSNYANEINEMSQWANYTIKFDRVLDEFTLCEYEAG